MPQLSNVLACCKAQQITNLSEPMGARYLYQPKEGGDSIPLTAEDIEKATPTDYTQLYLAAVVSSTQAKGLKALEGAGFQRVAEYPGYDNEPVYLMVKLGDHAKFCLKA